LLRDLIDADSHLRQFIDDLNLTAQADEIDSELQRIRSAGLLHFGTHRSTQALMTCVTPNVDNHEHIHFIDVGDGGLYSAARRLKAQMAADSDTR
jgi:hypothetical protein